MSEIIAEFLWDVCLGFAGSSHRYQRNTEKEKSTTTKLEEGNRQEDERERESERRERDHGFDLASIRNGSRHGTLAWRPAPRGEREHSPRKWTDGLEAAQFHLEQNQNPVVYIPARSFPRPVSEFGHESADGKSG